MKKIFFNFGVSDLTGATSVGLKIAKSIKDDNTVIWACFEEEEGENGNISSTEIERRFDHFSTCSFNRFGGFLRNYWALRQFNPDIIVSISQKDYLFSALLSIVTGIQLIAIYQNKRTFSGGVFTSCIKSLVYSVLLPRSKIVVAISEFTKRDAVERFGLSNDKVRIIRNYVDAPKIINGQKDNYRDLTIINVARINYQKGQDLLIDALGSGLLDELNYGVLFLGGCENEEDQEYYAKLIQSVNKYGIRDRVAFVGFTREVNKYLLDADVYIHCSRWEGGPLSLSIMEASLCKLPVIMSDCAGIPDGFYSGESTLTYKSGSVKSLRSTISRFVEKTEEEKRQIGIRCFEYVKTNCSRPVFENRYRSLILYDSDDRL